MGGEKAVNITIRPAIAEDADSLTAIQKQAFERLYKIYQDEASPYLRGSDEIKYQIVSGTRDIYKIFADDELCGGIAVRSKGNGEYYLNRVYVLPQLQGEGVGRKAITLCENNYSDVKRWTVDFPTDQLANKKCYEYSGYYDTGLREELSDKLTLAFYEKAVSGIFELRKTQFDIAAEVIRTSFATVANNLGLTEQNCPKYVGFVTTAERLQTHCNWGWLMYGLYGNKRLFGYVSISKEADGAYEMHNLAVLPEYRHMGYGKQLLDFCVVKVMESGGNKIKISITEENTALKNWYAAYGFVHTGVKKFEHLPFTSGYMELKVDGLCPAL